MRRSFVLMAILASGCRPKPTPDVVDAAIAVPSASASLAVPPPVDAAVPETPLTWGTRPAATGPLYPVIDGMCIHAEIRDTKGQTLYTYGTGTGHFSRGGFTTFARVEESGLVLDPVLEKSVGEAEAWARTGAFTLAGDWPNLVMRSHESGQGRVRGYSSLWAQTPEGWSLRATSAGEKGEPDYTGLLSYKGWLVSWRHEAPEGHPDQEWPTPTIRTWPIDKSAPPIEGIASLARANFAGHDFNVAGGSIYAFGSEKPYRAERPPLVRVLRDAQVMEGVGPTDGFGEVIGTKGEALLLLAGGGEKPISLRTLDGVKLTTLPTKLPSRELTSKVVAPNGDVWLVTTKHEVIVVHGDDVTLTALPEPKVKRGKEDLEHWPTTGSALAGVDFDDPYVIGDSGSLFHRVDGEWREVDMPKPPFATKGEYRAQTLVMPAKGDLMVNAGYAEKGIGWKTPERYRALLRTRRPKEVLRCNDPASGENRATGTEFASSPPIADDSCRTPFVLVLRLGSKESPSFLYDREGKFPTLRTAIKETPGLGATADLVEIPWGNLQGLGLVAPDMATAKALALNAVKYVKSQYLETRPEIVCGVPPKIEKTIKVDVATGKVITPDAN